MFFLFTRDFTGKLFDKGYRNPYFTKLLIPNARQFIENCKLKYKLNKLLRIIKGRYQYAIINVKAGHHEE